VVWVGFIVVIIGSLQDWLSSRENPAERLGYGKNGIVDIKKHK